MYEYIGCSATCAGALITIYWELMIQKPIALNFLLSVASVPKPWISLVKQSIYNPHMAVRTHIFISISRKSYKIEKGKGPQGVSEGSANAFQNLLHNNKAN